MYFVVIACLGKLKFDRILRIFNCKYPRTSPPTMELCAQKAIRKNGMTPLKWEKLLWSFSKLLGIRALHGNLGFIVWFRIQMTKKHEAWWKQNCRIINQQTRTLQCVQQTILHSNNHGIAFSNVSDSIVMHFVPTMRKDLYPPKWRVCGVVSDQIQDRKLCIVSKSFQLILCYAVRSRNTNIMFWQHAFVQ